ncbi:hypothetical protein, partial [Saezia sanguinis]|uniref:hypothetical protein n=1 Tax=Saezia sanguinis TaxID=1965230 RepID=UPI00194DC5AF
GALRRPEVKRMRRPAVNLGKRRPTVNLGKRRATPLGRRPAPLAATVPPLDLPAGFPAAGQLPQLTTEHHRGRAPVH